MKEATEKIPVLELSQVPLGPELDAMVAEKVMGWRREETYPGSEGDVRHKYRRIWIWFTADGKLCGCSDRLCAESECGDLPCFSADMGSAWLVVERMRELGYALTLIVGLLGSTSAHFGNYPPLPSQSTLHDTATEAICRAALAALQEKP